MFPLCDKPVLGQVVLRDEFLYSPADNINNFDLPTINANEDLFSDFDINSDELISAISVNKCDFELPNCDFNFDELDVGIDFDYCLLEALHNDRFNDTPLTGSDLSDADDISIRIPELNSIVPQESHTSDKFKRRSVLSERTDMLLRTFGEPLYCREQEAFQCPVEDCGKLYAKASHVRAHLLRHSGEKPYKCTWSGCSWSFARSDELSRHRRSHSGDKPYRCKECGKRFARSDHLAKHAKVHARRAAAAAAAAVAAANRHVAKPQRPRRYL